jgi:hypothetical protein
VADSQQRAMFGGTEVQDLAGDVYDQQPAPLRNKRQRGCIETAAAGAQQAPALSQPPQQQQPQQQKFVGPKGASAPGLVPVGGAATSNVSLKMEVSEAQPGRGEGANGPALLQLHNKHALTDGVSQSLEQMNELADEIQTQVGVFQSLASQAHGGRARRSPATARRPHAHRLLSRTLRICSSIKERCRNALSQVSQAETWQPPMQIASSTPPCLPRTQQYHPTNIPCNLSWRQWKKPCSCAWRSSKRSG